MSRYLALLLIIFMPLPTHAEYEELTILKESSHMAVQEYAERLSNVNPKFEGVVNFGKALQSIEDMDALDINQLTIENKDYWRAVLEMAPTDPSILFAHAHLHVVRGELARADTYFLLGSLAMDEGFQAEVAAYQASKSELEKKVAHDIEKGVQLHDKGQYAEAIEAYDYVISQHPNSAWAFYEKGLSYLTVGKDDPEFEKMRTEAYAECRRCDPFYVRAYQGKDHKLIQQFMILAKKVLPFASGTKRDLDSLKAYAEGCEEAELFPIAAHARWKLVIYDSENAEDHIRKFLDLLPKSGCMEVEFFRAQFKLDNEGPDKPSPASENK